MTPTLKLPGVGALAELDKRGGFGDQCIVIEGIVSPRSQGGWDDSTGSYQVHSFALAAWRRPSEPLVEQELKLARPVPLGSPLFDGFAAYSILRLSALLSQDQTRAVVEQTLPMDGPDEALLKCAARLRQPVVIVSDRFGELVLNQSVDWFEGNADWNGEVIEVTFERADDQTITQSLTTAERLFAQQSVWKRKVDDFAVKELLSTKNECWLAEGERELTAAVFKARMKLATIGAKDDGRFEFWHDDGDMFGGHSIVIHGNLKDGLTHSEIAG